MACTDSTQRQKELIDSFNELYKMNCHRAGKKLSCVENTKMFMSGSITRLLIPPRTHYADCLRRVSADLYVNVNIKK